jgi:hypothetical protein
VGRAQGKVEVVKAEVARVAAAMEVVALAVD